MEWCPHADLHAEKASSSSLVDFLPLTDVCLTFTIAHYPPRAFFAAPAKISRTLSQISYE